MAEIRRQDFAGLREAVVITTSKVQMAIRTDAGPRIVFFGKPGGANLLLCDNEDRARGDWKLMQGHRVWGTRPRADESEDAYRPDNGQCEVKITDNCAEVVSALDPVLKVRKGFSVLVEGKNKFTVSNFIRNDGDMLYSCGVWALTCTKPQPDTSYHIPLGDGSAWDCFTVKYFRRWGGHDGKVNDPQITMGEDMLTVVPRGSENKLMLEAPHGIIAMNAPGYGTFAKRTAYEHDAQYPYDCNLAFYIGPDNFMFEMETMSPEVTLRPGEAVYNDETWVLTDETGLSAAQLIDLF